MSTTAGWIITYVLSVCGFLALLHHVNGTHVTSNYTILRCHQ